MRSFDFWLALGANCSGSLWISGVVGWIVTLVGLVPLAAGIFDWCVIAPFFGLPFLGHHLRRTIESERPA